MKLATINSKSPRLRPAESIYRALHQETIRTALDRIGGELHAQYVLTYAPSSDPPVGFNEIKVTVSRPNLTIRARPGYYVSAAR